MAGELWLGWERFCAVRSCMVWYGWQVQVRNGDVRTGLLRFGRQSNARLVQDGQGVAWFSRIGKSCNGEPGIGWIRQAIKGGKLFMVYKWKDAARLKTDAQTAGEICEKLEKNGGLTAKRLVDESRPEDAPLHKEFEWDDATAAEAYREEQARYIIRSIVIQPEPTKNDVVRAFFPVAEQKVFESLPVILSDAKKTSALLDMALRELKAFELKYATLSQLAPVFEAIKEIEK